MEQGTTRARIDPSAERLRQLRAPLGVSTFGINQITLAPGQRMRIHRHERQEEVYLVFEGELTIGFGPADELTLSAGELIRVAPDVRRQLINRSGAPLTLIALGASQPHEGRDGVAYGDWDEQSGAPPADVPLPADLTRAD